MAQKGSDDDVEDLSEDQARGGSNAARLHFPDADVEDLSDGLHLSAVARNGGFQEFRVGASLWFCMFSRLI